MNSAWTRRGIVLAVAALVWMGGVLSAAVENEQTKVPATTLAVMDIAYIFKTHKAFVGDMKVLEQEAKAFQQSMQATDAQLKLLKARMEQTEDKAEKGKLEATLATQGTEFQLSVRDLNHVCKTLGRFVKSWCQMMANHGKNSFQCTSSDRSNYQKTKTCKRMLCRYI